MSMSALNTGLIFPEDLDGPRGTGSGDNEAVLWRAIKALRSALAGPGSPLVAFFGDGSPNGTEFIGNKAKGCAIGQVLVLGDQFQITTGNQVLNVDAVNRRVGVNTCVPLYTVDIVSNECGANVLALRNGNLTIDQDFFPNFTATPRARVEVTLKEGPHGSRYSIFTTDTTDTLQERLRIDEAGRTIARAAFALSGDITPAQITATQNDYNPAGIDQASILRLSTNASQNITGINGGVDGRILNISNIGTQNIVLQHQTGSAPFNQFSLPGGLDLTLIPGASVITFYDAVSGFWRIGAAGTNTISGSGATNRLAFWVSTNVLGATTSYTNHRILIGDTTGLPKNGPSLAAGEVIYADANGEPTTDNLGYDTFNHRLGAHTLTPDFDIDAFSTNPQASRGIAVSEFTNDAVGALFTLRKTRATAHGTFTAVSSSDIIGEIDFSATDGSAFQKGAIIEALAAEAFTSTHRGTYLSFQTAIITGTTMVEVFRVANITTGPQILFNETAAKLAAAPMIESHFGTNINLAMTASGNVAGAVSFQGYNDALTLNIPFEFRATKYVFLDAVHQNESLAGSLVNRFRYLQSMAAAHNSGLQTTTTGAVFTLSWDTNDINTDSIHSTTVNPTRFTAQIAGKYLIGGAARFTNSNNVAGSTRLFGYAVNGGATLWIGGGAHSATSITVPSGSKIVALNAADFVEFQCFQDDGINVTVDPDSSHAFMEYVGE